MLLLPATAPGYAVGEPPPAAVSAFNSYISTLESRLAQQHRSQDGFLAHIASDPQSEARLHRGELILQQLKPEQLMPSTTADLPGAMLHHWRGTAFAPGATAADFERLMKDFSAYPRYFSPQVLEAKVLSHDVDRDSNHLQAGHLQDDHFGAMMRVRQQHVITVVLDTTYDIAFGRLDARHG